MLETHGVVGLRINHRNIYAYVVNHYRVKPGMPCYVPPCPLRSNRLPQYIKAIEKLESLGIIVVDRSGGEEYTEWVVTLP